MKNILKICVLSLFIITTANAKGRVKRPVHDLKGCTNNAAQTAKTDAGLQIMIQNCKNTYPEIRTFEFYYSDSSIHVGTGGTRVTANGIDYWTHGQPPKRFRIIGAIFVIRGTAHMALYSAMDGKFIGSPKVAKLCKDNGGDAVIVDSPVPDTLQVVEYLQ